MMSAIGDLKFDVMRNAIYHTARRRWLESTNRLFNFVVIITGASAVADIASGFLNQKWFAFAATTAGALQLVFDFGGRAKTHEFLQKRYYDLISEIEALQNPSDTDRCKWLSDLNKIYADEPPTMRGLDAIAYNNAADALDREYKVTVTWYQSLFSQIYAFNATRFKEVLRK